MTPALWPRHPLYTAGSLGIIELPEDDLDILRIFVRTAHDQIVGVPGAQH